MGPRSMPSTNRPGWRSRSERKTNASVKPVSALELCRIGRKRQRRGQDWNNNSNGNSSSTSTSSSNNNNNDAGCQPDPTRASLSSPSPLPPLPCLLRTPGRTRTRTRTLSLPLGLTELAGPAGAGKTQVALSLCADCVQQHPSAKAVYVALGGSGRSSLHKAAKRLRDMLEARTRHQACGGSANGNGKGNGNSNSITNSYTNEWVHECLTRVLVHWVCNTEELTEVLQTRLPALLRKHHPAVSVVVLDGIANLFRLRPEHGSHGNDNGSGSGIASPWHDRAVALFRLSNACKAVSSRFGVPVLVLNGCTSRIPAAVAPTTTSGYNGGGRAVLEPALGLAWSQCVNSSWFVVRKPGTETGTGAARSAYEDGANAARATTTTTTTATNGGRGCPRVLRCRKAPHVSDSSGAEFWIDRSGAVATAFR